LPSLQELKGKNGILGAVLSGAGPSVLVFLDPGASMSKARKAVSGQIEQKGLTAELLPTAITLRGGKS
jgi:homoserine kinase